jgi:CheY-like chemotaxis protein
VEDVLSWQKTFKRYLQDEPFDLSVAADYQEALTLSETQTFDLVIIDINLSGVPHNVDGLHIADKIWRKNKEIKIVIVSGIDEPKKRLRSFDFELSCVLEKQSLDQDEFVKRVYQALTE